VKIYFTEGQWKDVFSIKIVGKVDPAFGGINSYAIESVLEILSICNIATFSMPDNEPTLYYQFVRESTKVVTFSEFIVSWTPESLAFLVS
jgi:hypothetical protein